MSGTVSTCVRRNRYWCFSFWSEQPNNAKEEDATRSVFSASNCMSGQDRCMCKPWNGVISNFLRYWATHSSVLTVPGPIRLFFQTPVKFSLAFSASSPILSLTFTLFVAMMLFLYVLGPTQMSQYIFCCCCHYCCYYYDLNSVHFIVMELSPVTGDCDSGCLLR